MSTRAFALLMGIVMGLLGVASLVPGLAHPVPFDAPPLIVSEAYGLVLGLFPVNLVDTFFYVGFGSLGVAAWNGWLSAAAYARLTAAVFTLLTIMGLTYPANTAFGLMPLYGADVVLHGLIAAGAAAYGFASYGSAAVYSSRQS